MNIREYGEKYGFNQEVYIVILDKDINQILASDGITPDQPDFIIKKYNAIKGLEELFNIFIDRLARILAFVRDGLSQVEIRERMSRSGFLGQRGL